ncbi:MAG: hypothetical protein NC489_24860 [Ruminococcus flavefaciens]|nr:hypothetical protein [Ruminococcus flavefaciens]
MDYQIYKNNKTICIEKNCLTLYELIYKFDAGTERIWIVDKGKLTGCITYNDMKNYLTQGKPHNGLTELINHKISFLTYVDEQRLYHEAERLFTEKKELYNIPVVDESGQFLFEMICNKERRKKSTNKKARDAIATVVKSGAMELFLKEIRANKIILTGARQKTLNIFKKLITPILKELENEYNISMTIIEDITGCCSSDETMCVISLSELGTFFLRSCKDCAGEIFYIEEIMRWKEFLIFDELSSKKVEHLVETFLQVFGYTTVIFLTDNIHIEQFLQIYGGGGHRFAL